MNTGHSTIMINAEAIHSFQFAGGVILSLATSKTNAAYSTQPIISEIKNMPIDLAVAPHRFYYLNQFRLWESVILPPFKIRVSG